MDSSQWFELNDTLTEHMQGSAFQLTFLTGWPLLAFLSLSQSRFIFEFSATSQWSNALHKQKLA
jgi:hypothetical protein